MGAADRLQRRHAFLGFPVAVARKFSEDRASSLAALIAYYGFFSLFPLLLALVSVLGLLLSGNPALRESIVRSALRDFPVIGPQLASGLHSIPESGLGLAVGLVGTIWAGLGVTLAAQDAMNAVWNVPGEHRLNFLLARLRGLLLLAILGSITVASALLSGFGASAGAHAMANRVLGVGVSLLLNLLLFGVSFRVLTRATVRWRTVAPGAMVAAVLWTAMVSLGGYYITHQIRSASEIYGTFAAVIGTLVWIHLGAQLTLFCAEINVVRDRRLWPRPLSGAPRPPVPAHD